MRIFKGNPLEIIPALVEATEAGLVFWNRCYEPWRIARDTILKAALEDSGIVVQSYNGSLLWEPWEIKKSDGTPYKVFTPYFRRGCLSASSPRIPMPVPDNFEIWTGTDHLGDIQVDDLGLLPKENWHKQFIGHWTPGEAGPQKLEKVYQFSLAIIRKAEISCASPHVTSFSSSALGEISPNQVVCVRDILDAGQLEVDADNFPSELGWRNFSLLFYCPLPRQNLQPKFDNFPWDQNADHLRRWQSGQTGYPIVDAAMRELKQTGYMHNRLRMVVGSFLVKNLRLHWHQGEAWFWDCLVDADLASNSASWQWIAGCGADGLLFSRFQPGDARSEFDQDGALQDVFFQSFRFRQNIFQSMGCAAAGSCRCRCGVGRNLPTSDC